jgi:hypothetical protein
MQLYCTPNHFNSLSNAEKFTLLEESGVHLEAYYITGPYKVALFELYGYNVAVWLHQPQDRLTKARAFTDYEALDPFLQSIDIMPVYSVL